MRVLRAAEGFVTAGAGIRTVHSFSFGSHFDPATVGHGALLVCNDERLNVDSGYDLHRHADVEIVTWVLSGTLTHEDDSGHRQQVPSGGVQCLGAGAGVRHTERNASPEQPLRFVQMWLRPDRLGTVPSYACDVPSVVPGTWTEVVGGDASVGLGIADAVLRVARLPAHAEVELPRAPRGFLFVATGRVDVTVTGAGSLGEGDALLLCNETAVLRATEQAQVLAWRLPAQ